MEMRMQNANDDGDSAGYLAATRVCVCARCVYARYVCLSC